MNSDARLARITERQFGVFSLNQARSVGLSKDDAVYRVKTGRWTRLHRAVYRLCGLPACSDGLIFAAVLAAGEPACASHASAATLLSLAGIPVPDEIEVSVSDRRAARVPGV